MLHHPAFSKPTAAKIPAIALFEEYLPKILEIRAAASKHLGGRLGIQLRGAQAYTIDFGQARVDSGIGESLGALLDLTTSDCEALMQGKLDFSALQPGQITCVGDGQLLTTLGILLRPEAFGKRSKR